MTRHTIDVAILGAGTAGLTARRSALKQGASVLMIDPGPLGTTCARVGCMPSKLLIAAAEAAHAARGAHVFGVHTESVTVDGAAVLARVKTERDRFVGFVLDSTREAEEAGQLVRARGRFTSDTGLELDNGDTVEAKAVVVATGSSPWTPPPFRSLGDLLLDNEGIFDLDDLPESLLVVGTGVVGIEIGQALHRLGVRVTLVGIGGDLAGLSDEKVKSVAEQVLGDELDLHPDYTLESIERVDGGVHVVFKSGGDRREGTYERVLIAAGRRPNLREIGLEHTGLSLDDKGMPPVDPRTLQAGDLPIFVPGDSNNDRPLLHEAADEGHIAGANAARYPTVLAGQRRAPLAIVFSDPQIAVVGTPARSLAGDAVFGEVSFFNQGRSRVMNKHKGWVRVYADPCGKLVGAEMFGPAVEHTAHLLAWAVQQGMCVDTALAMPFYHPVVEEGIRTALRNLQTNLKLAPPPAAPCEECGVGS